ncbi:MAG: hypothetical protein ACRDSP_23975 [Pseudonocardiaceae bacterium]
MRATRLTLAAVVLGVGTLLLTGCDPSTTAGGSGASGSRGLTCDPNGFGPLTGCDSADSSGHTPASTETTPAEADTTPAKTDTAPCETDPNGPGVDAGWFNDTKDGNDCVTSTGPTPAHQGQAGNQKITQTTDHNITVTVTWIVVNIDITGFQECVIDLRETRPNPDDHVNRRLTTAKDCEAQHVDTVYRPVGE